MVVPVNDKLASQNYQDRLVHFCSVPCETLAVFMYMYIPFSCVFQPSV